MRFLPLISLLFCLNQKCIALDLNTTCTFSNSYDTIRKKIKSNDSLINAVIENKITPPKETAEQINNFTKYGFKNLFTQYNYNPALPYSSQINPNAELFMSDYLRVHKTQLLKMKSYAVPYFDLIDNIFTQYGLPKELKYLAVIESSLKTSATSWVGAAGPWQFMPQTGIDYGLKITRYNDERRDYFKSTHAAAKFLLKLYADFRDWLLVIAAYNGGPARVYSAIKKSSSNDFWKLQYYLPLESRNHVKKFITTHYIMESKNMDFKLNDKATLNKSNLNEVEASNADTLLVSGKYKSKVIIKNIQIESDIFQKYNPEFDQMLLKKGEYEMILPSDKMNLFKQNKYAILNECVQLALEE
jgi:membrane-bound lytic murein transglycosylase D